MHIGPALAFLGGSVGAGELLVVFLVVLVLFGPRRLPEIARHVGRFFAELRHASQDFRDQVMRIDETPHSRGPASLPGARPTGPTDVSAGVSPSGRPPSGAGGDSHSPSGGNDHGLAG